MLLGVIKTLIQNHLPWLFVPLADLRDRVAPRYGEAELSLVPRLVPAGEAAFDVGANTGMYSFWLLRSAAHLTSFEPNARLCAILRQRFARAIASGRMQVEAVAVSNRRGQAELFVEPGFEALASVEANHRPPAAVHGGEVLRVPTVRLDDYDKRRVGFIKIDVEGHEVAAVEGGLTLIARDRPTILVEAEERHHAGAVPQLRALLEPLGYQGFYLHQGRLNPVAGFDPAVLQDRAALNEAGTHRVPGKVYVNNFIFAARPEALADLARGV